MQATHRAEDNTTSETPNIGLKDAAGIVRTTDAEKVKIHADHLEKTFSQPEDSSFDQEWQETVNNLVDERREELNPLDIPDPDVLIHEAVTPEEVLEELKTMKNKSAPGGDGISYKVLKCGGWPLILHLSFLFTMILATGYFPDEWKLGIAIMLAKPLKDHKLSKS